MNFWKVLFIFALIRGSFSNLKLTSKMNDSNLGWRMDWKHFRCLTFHRGKVFWQCVHRCVYCNRHQTTVCQSEHPEQSIPASTNIQNYSIQCVRCIAQLTSPKNSGSSCEAELCSSSFVNSISIEDWDTRLNRSWGEWSSIVVSSSLANSRANNSLQSSLRNTFDGDRFSGVMAKWFSSGDFSDDAALDIFFAMLKLVISDPSSGEHKSEMVFGRACEWRINAPIKNRF